MAADYHNSIVFSDESQNTLIVIDNPEPQQDEKEKYRQIPNKAMAKFKRLPFIKKIGLIVSLPLSLLFYTYLFRTLLTNHLMQESFLEVWKCPACYGQSMCSRLMSGNYTFVGLSSIRFFDYTNVKNTHFIKSQSGKIVLKKLGHDSELKTLDKQICTDAGYDADYDCSRAVYQTKPALKREVSPTVIKGLSPAMHCVSQRLVDRILKYYTERKSKDEFHIDDKMQLVTTLKINAEPIIMQVIHSYFISVGLSQMLRQHVNLVYFR